MEGGSNKGGAEWRLCWGSFCLRGRHALWGGCVALSAMPLFWASPVVCGFALSENFMLYGSPLGVPIDHVDNFSKRAERNQLIIISARASCGETHLIVPRNPLTTETSSVLSRHASPTNSYIGIIISTLLGRHFWVLLLAESLAALLRMVNRCYPMLRF
jgi:hypothetical protein